MVGAGSSSSSVVGSSPRPATPAELSVTPPGALAPSCRDPLSLPLTACSYAYSRRHVDLFFSGTPNCSHRPRRQPPPPPSQPANLLLLVPTSATSPEPNVRSEEEGTDFGSRSASQPASSSRRQRRPRPPVGNQEDPRSRQTRSGVPRTPRASGWHRNLDRPLPPPPRAAAAAEGGRGHGGEQQQCGRLQPPPGDAGQVEHDPTWGIGSELSRPPPCSYSRTWPPTTNPCRRRRYWQPQAGRRPQRHPTSKGARHSSLGSRGTAGGSAGPVRLGPSTWATHAWFLSKVSGRELWLGLPLPAPQAPASRPVPFRQFLGASIVTGSFLFPSGQAAPSPPARHHMHGCGAAVSKNLGGVVHQVHPRSIFQGERATPPPPPSPPSP